MKEVHNVSCEVGHVSGNQEGHMAKGILFVVNKSLELGLGLSVVCNGG